jgi:O-antigen ligase
MYGAALDRRKAALLLAYAGLAGHAFFVPISIAGMQIALGVAAAGVLLALPRPLRTVLDKPLATFVLLAVISDLISAEGPPPLAYATLWRSALGFFVVAHGLRLLPRDAPLKIVFCACAGLLLSSAVGLVQYRTGVDLVYLSHLRASPALVEAPGVPGRFGAMGFFTSRLSFGHNATVVLAFLLGAMAAGALPKRRLFIAAGAALLGLAAVAVTFDRAAYLALGAAAAVIAAAAAPRVRKILIPALAALLLLAALNGGVRNRFESAFSSGGNADRVFLWRAAVEIIRDHPLRGIGFGNYPRVCGRYYDRLDPSVGMRTWAHNLELSTLAETGPLGLLAMLSIFAVAAWALLRRLRPGGFALGGLAALTALFVIAQAHDVVYDTKVMYALWLVLGLSLFPAEEASPGSPPARSG